MAALWLYIMHGNNTGGALSWRELNLKRYISTPARRMLGGSCLWTRCRVRKTKKAGLACLRKCAKWAQMTGGAGVIPQGHGLCAASSCVF